MKVKVVDYLGSDLTVVNAARVSMGKRKSSFDSSDERLIKFLLKHKHWSPFEHCSITFYLELPIFVARQLMRHKWSFNEISGRYVELQDKMYIPEIFREQDESIKQGSKTEEESNISQDIARSFYEQSLDASYKNYKWLLSIGVCKEQARAVLPLAAYTELYATCSLRSFIHYLDLRLKPDAQKEIRDLSLMMLKGVAGIEGNPFEYSLKEHQEIWL